jgi:hypothetical protein
MVPDLNLKIDLRKYLFKDENPEKTNNFNFHRVFKGLIFPHDLSFYKFNLTNDNFRVVFRMIFVRQKMSTFRSEFTYTCIHKYFVDVKFQFKK